MKVPRAKVKQHLFIRELNILLFVLAVSFLPYLHTFGSETSSTLSLLGFSYTHRHDNNQVLFWFQLNFFQILAFLFLLFNISSQYFKYALLYPIYCLINEICWKLFPLDIMVRHEMMFEVISIVIAIGLAYIVKNKKVSYQSIFPKIKIHQIFIGVFYIVLTFCFRKLINMPDTIQEVDFLGFTISAYSFISLPAFLYIFSLKLLLVSTLILLLFNIKRWWRYSFLIPISLTIFQIYSIVFSDSEGLDEHEIFQALPLLFLVFILLLFLSRSAYYNSQLKRLYHNTVSQMEQNKEHLLGDKFNYFQQRWKNVTNSNYKKGNGLSELNDLKRELERQLGEYWK